MRAGGIKASAMEAWKKACLAPFAALLTLGFAHAGLAQTKSKHATVHHHVASRTTHHHVAAGRANHELAGRANHQLASHSTHSKKHLAYSGHHRTHVASYSHSRLQCVPYAREVSHIQLSGNAFLWWAAAAGRYARGNAPAEGAVLDFRSIRRMPLGHVAVVTGVVDSRTILITQANWIPGTITNDVTVQDVSPNNDWTQVQVELGDGQRMGSSYPTYGFIYNKPDTGVVIASSGQSDAVAGDEVAEAPRAAIQTEAPDRNLQ